MKINIPVALFSCALMAGALLADEPKKGAPSPEEKAAMEAMAKAGTPGDAHKKLSAMVGDFNTKVSMYPAPGAPAQTSTGVSHNKWVLGGRFVQENFSGTFMGQPFSGIGYTGYDNMKQTYVGSWMDSMSTAMMSSKGTIGADGKYTFESTMDDPVSGKTLPIKEVVTVTDKDHHTFEMWTPDQTGAMFKMMEITYTRVKK